MLEVSVLMPVRDAVVTLEAALASVLRSRDVALECVVVDDGSGDGSLALARRVAAWDARVRVIETPPRGIVAALCDGLAACRAPLVARMDADDVMHRDRLRAQRDALRDEASLDAVGCHVRVFPRARITDGLRAYERWLNAVRTPEDVAREVFIECPIAHPTLVARREMLVQSGWRDAGWAEDYDLVLRWLGEGRRIGIVPRRLVAWRDGPTRLSRTHPAYAQERFVACKAHWLARGFLAQSPRYVLWGHGATGRALRRALLAEGRAVSHVIELDPRKIGQRIDGAPVVSPAALPSLRGHRIVASVSGPTPRAEIRTALTEAGFQEGPDFLCTA